MKKLSLTLLLGSCLFASDGEHVDEAPVFEQTTQEKNHELTPNFRWFKHKEADYTYSKYVGGLEYNYKRSEGVNFTSFVGYSFYRDKSYFVADWGLKYLTKFGTELKAVSFYPLLGMSNTSHFSVNSEQETFQIYRSAFTGGLGAIYMPGETIQLEGNINYFKDLATSCILHRGDEFWGKSYYSPAGYKVNVAVRLNSILSKDLEIGGFYAKTFKKCYSEFGFKTSVAFAF